MNYLDERIIANVTLKYPSLGDRLYRYDVAINNEWESPVFIGNCFIGADVPTKAIDITDIVRNYYDFSYPYNDTEFKSEWQVRIWLDADELEHSYSDKIGIYPIYRYPNRKARMETPLSNNGLNWYMPALQGFNSDKKGEFLPHIPFVWSDKVDYNIAVNIGNLRDVNPYLYTGVKKQLETPADFGIFNTRYKLSELWKGTEVETLDWDFDTLGHIDNETVYDTYKYTTLSPVTYAVTISSTPDTIEYGDPNSTTSVKITEFPFVFDTPEVNLIENDYFDFYVNLNNGNTLNIYPEVTTTCKAKAHIFIDEAFENDVNLIMNVNPTAPQVGDYFAVNASGITELQITLKDGDTAVRTVTVGQGSETFSILDTESISNFVFTAGTTEYAFYLDQKCSAGNGFEYIFNFVFSGTYIKIYPLTAKYEVDATFKTFRVLDASLETSSINIQNDGTDNLTASDKIRFVENKQTLEVVYGSQELQSPNTGKQIVSKLTNPTWSYALVDKSGKLLTHNTLAETSAFPTIEGDFELYIFAISGADYEVTKIMTKDFGLTKNFQLQFLTNNTSVLLIGWNAFLNNSTKYQQYVTSKNIIEVAKVDACPSRYYLQWRDRYGSMQMQPFCKVDTYTEDLTRTEIKNYQDTRSLSNISIQPKWKLNTKWLNNTVYPYYESLLVSPWIKMYDTKEDTVYDVIITSSDYTEKTFKNQSRQQFNLQIDVEAVNTQNIIY